MYILGQPDWPKLTWQDTSIATPLAAVRHDRGRLIGRMEALGFKLREEAVLQTLTQDVVKTSGIEGEQLDATQVRSSQARRLGIDIGALLPTDRNVEGIVEVMLDATGSYEAPSPPSACSAGMQRCSPPGAAASQARLAGSGYPFGTRPRGGPGRRAPSPRSRLVRREILPRRPRHGHRRPGADPQGHRPLSPQGSQAALYTPELVESE